MKIQSFCIYVFLFIFCAITFDLGANGGSAPKLVFKSWKAGQGVNQGPYDPVTQQLTSEEKTFLTDTETTCSLDVKVVYASNQAANAYRLNRFKWQVEGGILLQGLPEAKQNQHTFAFTGTETQQGATGDTGTTFNYSGAGTLSEHWGGSRSHCSNYSGTTQPQKGRSLSIDVTFIGYYGTDPNNEQKIEIKLPLEQDEIDQMRQEYLDQRGVQRVHKPNDTTISVPNRAEFSSGNEYSDAHAHSLMIDKDLETKKLHWAQACDKYVGEILEKNHRIESLHKTGGYRNAHHHLYHVVSSIDSETAFRSLHQYGLALDVRTVDMNGNNILENTAGS